MLIAFLLVFAVIFATPYFYKLISPPAPIKKVTVDTSHADASKVDTPQSRDVPAPSTSSTPSVDAASINAAALTPAAAAATEFFVIDTDLYHIIFSNQGAVVKSWTLKEYKDANGKPLELINPTAAEKVGYVFAYTFREKKPSVDLTKSLFVTRPHSDGLGIDFEFSNGKVLARKTFEFQKHGYLSTVLFPGERKRRAHPRSHAVARRIRRPRRAERPRPAIRTSLRQQRFKGSSRQCQNSQRGPPQH